MPEKRLLSPWAPLAPLSQRRCRSGPDRLETSHFQGWICMQVSHTDHTGRFHLPLSACRAAPMKDVLNGCSRCHDLDSPYSPEIWSSTGHHELARGTQRGCI